MIAHSYGTVLTLEELSVGESQHTLSHVFFFGSPIAADWDITELSDCVLRFDNASGGLDPVSWFLHPLTALANALYEGNAITPKWSQRLTGYGTAGRDGFEYAHQPRISVDWDLLSVATCQHSYCRGFPRTPFHNWHSKWSMHSYAYSAEYVRFVWFPLLLGLSPHQWYALRTVGAAWQAAESRMEKEAAIQSLLAIPWQVAKSPESRPNVATYIQGELRMRMRAIQGLRTAVITREAIERVAKKAIATWMTAFLRWMRDDEPPTHVDPADVRWALVPSATFGRAADRVITELTS
ncbi:MAG: hypothetical protein ACT4P6_09810 [Gemmatimonadaceae bacterium]